MFIAEKALSTVAIATSKINAKVTNGYETSFFFFFNNYQVRPIVLYYSCTFLFLKVHQATVQCVQTPILFNVEIFFFLIITKWDPLVLYIRIVLGGEVY